MPSDLANRAERSFAEGTRAFEEQRYADAYAALRTAWELVPSYRTAAALGQVELALGQYRDAAEHLAYCLRRFPEDADATVREHVERGLEDAREHVGALRIRVNIGGAAVTVDGTTVGRAPLEGPVFVEPGTHTVAAHLDGDLAPEERVDVPLRSTRDVYLRVTRARAAEPPTTQMVGFVTRDRSRAPRPSSAAPAHAEAHGLSPSTWALLVGGTLTAAALGTSGYFALDGASRNRDVQNLGARIPGGDDACSNPAGDRAALCSELRNARDQRNASNQAATVGLVTAGALAAMTASVALILGSAESTPERVGVLAQAGPGGGGLAVGGAF